MLEIALWVVLLIRNSGLNSQAQTAECLVLGEIATQRLLVVLNKIDLLPPANQEKLVGKAKKLLQQTFAHTKFKSSAMVAVAAKPGWSAEVSLLLPPSQ